MIRLSARIALTSRRGTASVACTASTNLRRKQLVCLTTARSPPHTAPTSIGHDERSNVRCQPTSCLSTAAAIHPHVKNNTTEERRVIQQRDQRLKTPPMEEESGPAIRDMRAQLRSDRESGSRGSRRVRKAGKIPGVVYSNNDNSPKGSRGEPICVQIDKIIVDREIRRLKASFENTVYNLVIEGAAPAEEDEGDDVTIAVRDPDADPGGVQESNGDSPVAMDNEGPKERRELVLANECRLHPVLRTVMSVNWMRYKAGRKYPIPIKFINNDLNDNFKKGAYIRRLKTHQHIHLPDDPAKVPKWLYLDLEFVRSGNKLRVSDIIIPDGIRFFRGNEPDMWKEIVCTIKGKKAFSSGDVDEEEEEEED